MIPFPYADENPHPESRAPVIALILVNVACLAVFNRPEDYETWGFIPAYPAPHALITSQFIHADYFHLLGNMWFLYVFGDNVAARLRRFFVPFYLLGGVAAAAADYATSPSAVLPGIGASGAVCAVVGAYSVLFPGARLKCVQWLPFHVARFGMSALLWGGLYVGWQVLSSRLFAGDLVSYDAHVGGLLFGAAIGAILRGAAAPAPAP